MKVMFLISLCKLHRLIWDDTKSRVVCPAHIVLFNQGIVELLDDQLAPQVQAELSVLLI